MDIRNNIWDFIATVAVSGLPNLAWGDVDQQIYWVRQNIDMPDSEPFITLEMGNAITIGKERMQRNPENPEDPDIVEQVKTHWNVDVDINVYCKDAYEAALMIVNSLRESASLEQLRQSKLGIVSVGIVTDISAVVDTVWSGRAHFMIVFSFKYVKENTVTAIYHAPIKGEVDNTEILIEQVVDRPEIILG